MSHKKLALFSFLSILSIVSGAVFGLLDVFGFVDGRHALSLTLLIFSIVIMYFITITVFLLNFVTRNRILPFFGIASLLFATTFFLMNLNPFLTFTSSILYLVFLFYSYDTSGKRAKMFISFSPKEIFFPIIKTSFLYFMIVLALLAFVQSKKLVSQNSLVNPTFIKIVSRPMIITLNKQINSQLQTELRRQLPGEIAQKDREKVSRQVLEATVQSMAQNDGEQLFGFKAHEIPIEKAIVYQDGQVDLAPVIDNMLPLIAFRLNEQIQKYAVFAPLIVAGIVVLVVQPFIYPLEAFEALCTLLLFKALKRGGFLKIKKESKEVDVIEI